MKQDIERVEAESNPDRLVEQPRAESVRDDGLYAGGQQATNKFAQSRTAAKQVVLDLDVLVDRRVFPCRLFTGQGLFRQVEVGLIERTHFPGATFALNLNAALIDLVIADKLCDPTDQNAAVVLNSSRAL